MGPATTFEYASPLLRNAFVEPLAREIEAWAAPPSSACSLVEKRLAFCVLARLPCSTRALLAARCSLLPSSASPRCPPRCPPRSPAAVVECVNNRVSRVHGRESVGRQPCGDAVRVAVAAGIGLSVRYYARNERWREIVDQVGEERKRRRDSAALRRYSRSMLTLRFCPNRFDERRDGRCHSDDAKPCYEDAT
eukprot:6211266-Pleurochrysis_carterae.AAC.1